jgi:ornithine cyclodeaminase/alanine dehydrogenase-like protein (mu-crystallin family)
MGSADSVSRGFSAPSLKRGVMLIVDEERAQTILATLDLPALVANVVHAQASGDAVVPVRSVVRRDGVWFAAMPALIAGQALGAKLVAAFPGNIAAGLPSHQAVVVLLDPHTGALDAIVAAEALTRYRTAALSVVATRMMATRPEGIHAILGSGAQAQAHVDAFARAGIVRELQVWSRTPAHAQALVEYARTLGIHARTYRSANDAVRGSDVVTTVTGAAEPLFADDALCATVHVNAIGACVNDKREIPGAFVERATIAVDSLAAARVESGDLLLALTPEAPQWRDMKELGASKSSTGPSLFISLGIGSIDVAVAAEIVARVRASSATS